MNDKVKFERRSGIWNVRFPDGKNRSYKNQDLAEQAINTFLAQNPKYTAVMGRMLNPLQNLHLKAKQFRKQHRMNLSHRCQMRSQ